VHMRRLLSFVIAFLLAASTVQLSLLTPAYASSGSSAPYSGVVTEGAPTVPPQATQPQPANWLYSSNVNIFAGDTGTVCKSSTGAGIPCIQNEPTIAENLQDPLNVAAGSHVYFQPGCKLTDGWAATYRSLDGGTTWSEGCIPSGGSLAAFGASGDAVVRSGPGLHQMYYSGIAFSRTTTGAGTRGTTWVTMSTDGGLTYQDPTITALGSSLVFNDKSWLAVDTNAGSPGLGNVYQSYTDFVGTISPIKFVQCLAPCNTPVLPFTASITISDPTNLGLQDNQGSSVSVTPTGRVIVVWENYDQPSYRGAYCDAATLNCALPINWVQIGVIAPLTLASQTDGHCPLPGLQYRCSGFPALSTDPSRAGNAYMVYTEFNVAKGQADVKFVRSTNGGVTWSAPVILNDDTGFPHQHIFPAISTAPNGDIGAAWFDTRLSPTQIVTATLQDVFTAKSTDGGVTWEPNQRATDVSSNPSAGSPFTNGAFYGDYNDVTLSQSCNGPAGMVDIHPVWTDNRRTSTGLQDIFSVLGTQSVQCAVPPSLTTTLSQTSIAAGGSVADTATLANLNAPTGTITFFFSSTNTCPNAGATQVGAPVTVTGNGAYTSGLQTFPIAGTFYWYAVYSGDANNHGLTSACEPLTVRGGTPIPEFGAPAILMAAIGMLGVAVLARKHRMSLATQA